MRITLLLGVGALAATAGCTTSTEEVGGAAESVVVSPLAPLWTEPVPQLTNSDIKNTNIAVRLGKALFWDVQVGGDGQTACASCHFRGGADDRITNTVNPGVNGRFQLVRGAGETWDGTTDPMRIDDIIGSQGVPATSFVGISSDPSVAADLCDSTRDRTFKGHRQVTGRNTPTVIAAIFNYDNFWDGRANHIFNGSDPFGEDGSGSRRMENGSLASQAVGPPNNEVEMSCFGRSFQDLGAKLLARPPLQLQRVSPDDSALGEWADPSGNGLWCGTTSCSYRQMIHDAFGEAIANDAENQFASIWGQAVQAYAATLVPDRAPIDYYLAGNTTALTPRQQEGFALFQGEGRPETGALCMNCHHGPLFTDATTRFVSESGTINFDGGDTGFHNVGVDPTEDDIGRGAFSVSGGAADMGAFKTPTLRNVALTAPYFHDGSATSLEQVVRFYDRGGNFDNPEKSSVMPPLADTPGQLGFTNGEITALVDFLENALTDCRVVREEAPFDHPSLPLPNGRSGDLPAVGRFGNGASCP